jgi:hypothetical protein
MMVCIYTCEKRRDVAKYCVSVLLELGMCVIVANIMEQCSLFLPLQRSAGPMALMLWLDWVT